MEELCLSLVDQMCAEDRLCHQHAQQIATLHAQKALLHHRRAEETVGGILHLPSPVNDHVGVLARCSRSAGVGEERSPGGSKGLCPYKASAGEGMDNR